MVKKIIVELTEKQANELIDAGLAQKNSSTALTNGVKALSNALEDWDVIHSKEEVECRVRDLRTRLVRRRVELIIRNSPYGIKLNKEGDRNS